MASTFRVPFGRPEAGCQPDEIAFRAQVADANVDQTLYYRLFVNGDPRSTIYEILPSANRAEFRATDRPACLPKRTIDGIPSVCSIVTMMVTSDLQRAQTTLDLADLSPDTAYLHWQVLKSSEIDPESEPSSCDEVALSDAGLPPTDGGPANGLQDAGAP